MGFLDKAKKLAEQAQTKLDEVQQQVNSQGSSSTSAGGPVTDYDQHGRPIPPEKSATPPHGDPLRPEGESVAPPPPAPPTPDPAAPIAATPGVPPTDPSPPVEGQGKAPAMPGAPPSSDDDPYAPPKLTGGDPLAG